MLAVYPLTAEEEKRETDTSCELFAWSQQPEEVLTCCSFLLFKNSLY